MSDGRDIADAEATAPQGGRTAAFGFIFASAVASAMSIGLMVPILPNLVKQFNGGSTAAAADWNVAFATFGGLMSFLAGPVLGLMSDRFGRRPILLISLFGLGVDFLFMAFAPTLGWLFLGRLISGATSAVFSTANAYVADVTPPERRARAFGWMGSAFSVGFLAGPAIGGFLGNFDLRWPFMAGAGLTLLNWLYGMFVVPESLPPERRAQRFVWRKANPIGSLKLLSSHHELLGLAGIYFLNQLAQMIWPTVYVLYVTERYGWNPGVIGMAMAAGSVLGVGVQSFVVGPAIRRFGELGCMLIGLGAITFTFSWYGWAPSGWVYLAGLPVSSLGGLVIPGLQGLMTRCVGPSEQGQLQGANQSMAGLGNLIGPSIFGLSFAWAVRNKGLGLVGLPMFEASAICAACLMLGVLAARRARVAH